MNQIGSNGASNTLFEHSRPNQPDSSLFDYSRITNLTGDVGMIIPVDCFKVYPGDNVKLDSVIQLDTLPLVQSSLTQYKITTHWYYQKHRDQWKGAKTQATRGRSGNVSLNTPLIDLNLPLGGVKSFDSVNVEFESDTSGDLQGSLYPIGNHSLSAFIGVPPIYQGIYSAPDTSSEDFSINKAFLPYSFVSSGSDSRSEAFNEIVKTGFNNYRYVNALPFVMYQSIVKNNYVNQNLLQENTSLFPVQGDDDWLLPYNATVTNFLDYSSNNEITGNEVYSYDGVFTSSDNVTRLDQLRYAQFDDDYFTTGLPWLQRGDVTSLELSTSGLADVGVKLNDVFEDLGINAYNPASGVPRFEFGTFSQLGASTIANLSVQATSDSASGAYGSNYNGSESSANYNKLYADLSTTTAKAILTANELRGLIAMSVWQERNARVNGSYNRMIYQHWKVDPNSEEHQPVYIGGTVDYINFNTVLQNSASTGSSPLGSTAGFGNSSGSSSINNNFYCPDYGYIMGILIIKPVTYYQQGVEHFLSCENTFEDLVYPEFQNLSPEPIYNKEIYVTGDDDQDNDLFGYQERMTYAKVRNNVNRGLFQVQPDKDLLFGSFTQARWFDSKPVLSYQFLCMYPDNLRRDWLAYPSYPAFRIQFLTQAHINRKLAYSSQPETFGF